MLVPKFFLAATSQHSTITGRLASENNSRDLHFQGNSYLCTRSALSFMIKIGAAQTTEKQPYIRRMMRERHSENFASKSKKYNSHNRITANSTALYSIERQAPSTTFGPTRCLLIRRDLH